MTLQSVIMLVLLASVFLFVLAIGLSATLKDATDMFREPGKLLRAFLGINVVMPLFSVVLVLIFKFDPAVEIALVALSVSPIPPVLPAKLMKEGGTASYAISLLTTAALGSIITVPVTMAILSRVFDLPLQMSPMSIVPSISIAILAPIILGIIVHHFAPVFSVRIASMICKVGVVGLLVSMAAIWINAASDMWTLVGNGTVIALALFVLVGLAVGHFLGGPKPEDRTALAISTASRHPGIALAIAAANFPDVKLASAAILLYLLINAVASIPYLKWNRHRIKGLTPVDEPGG